MKIHDSIFSIHCPADFTTDESSFLDLNKEIVIVNCRHCPEGSYSPTDNYYIYNKTQNALQPKQKNTCQPCPTGGICKRDIVNQKGYWGYHIRNGTEVVFNACQEGFCSPELPSTINSCSPQNECTSEGPTARLGQRRLLVVHLYLTTENKTTGSKWG